MNALETFTEITFIKIMLALFSGIHMDAAKRAVTAAQHLIIFQSQQQPARNHPGLLPAGVQEHHNAGQRAEIECSIKLYLHEHEQYVKQTDEDKAFKAALIEVCPPETIESITSGVTGTCHLSNAMILAHLYADYGTITDADLDRAADELPTQLASTTHKDLLKVVNKQKQYFQLKAHAGQTVPNSDKINLLSKMLPETLDLHIALFDKDYPALDARTYELFSAAMLDAIKRLRTPKRSANAVSASVAVADAKNWDEFMANAAASATAAGFVRPAATNTNPRRNVKSANTHSPASKYCWSHGINNSHQSSECKTTHVNHVKTATLTNPQGGKSSEWVRGQPLGP